MLCSPWLNKEILSFKDGPIKAGHRQVFFFLTTQGNVSHQYNESGEGISTDELLYMVL